MTSISSRIGKIPWLVFATGLYIVTALAYFVVPVADRFDHVLLGSTPFAYDSVLNAGILEWGFRALWDPQLSLFDWTAGFPLKNTLAGTEHLIGWQVFYSPLRAAGLGVPASYNVVMLLSFVVSGVGTALLARRLGASRAGATLGGFVFAFNPFHIDHAIHIQTMVICWSPFALIGLDMTLEKKGLRGPILLAVSFIITALCGMYFLVFLPIVLALYAVLSWAFGRHPYSSRAVRDLILAGAVSALALLPVMLPYLRFASTWASHPQTAEVLTQFSLPLVGLVKVPDWVAVWQHTRMMSPAASIGAFPGFVALFLAGVAFARRGNQPETRAVPLILLTLAIATFLCALGPVLTVRKGIPFEPLEWLPLPGRVWLSTGAIRWTMRIFLYSVLSGAVLAALGLTRLQGQFAQRQMLVSAVLLMLVWVELRPATWYASRSHYIYEPMAMSDAYPFLSSEEDRGGVVELPARTETGWATPYATRYAYGSAGHLRGVVAFHHSRSPAPLDTLRLAIYRLPEQTGREFLASRGVTRLVIHKNILPVDSGTALARIFLKAGYPLLYESPLSAVFGIGKVVQVVR